MSSRSQIISIAGRALAVALLIATSQAALARQQRPRQVRRQPSAMSWTIPADTVISMRLDRSLSSKTSRVGDRFTATVTIPVHANGMEVIPAGAVVEGRVTEVTPAKRMSRSGAIAIDFDELILPDGSRLPIEGNLTSDDPETRERIDDESRVSGRNENRPAVFVGGGGAIGAVLGGIAGGGKGAVLGGVIGAGAGVAGILLSKGEEAQVPAGAPFGIQLTQPLVIRESAVAQNIPQPDDDPVRDSDPDPDKEIDAENRPVEAPPTAPTRTEPVPESEPLPLSSPEMIRRSQHALRDNGYYEGEIDGVMTPRTSRSLRTYQRENSLPETGNLDEATARKLGILGVGTARSVPAREATSRSPETRSPERGAGAGSDSVLATVLSASANRTSDGAIHVLITTQAPTGGWRWFGDSVVNGDTLEVYARAIRPAGMATQVLTRGRIELNVRDGVRYVRRVVVHGASGDINIPLGGRAGSPSGGSPSGGSPSGGSPSGGSPASSSAASIQRLAQEILADYQRLIGVRLTGTDVVFENGSQNREPEIELLFALDNFANASQLYSRLIGSLQRDRNNMRGATLALAREARRTDRVMTTTSSRAASQLIRRWDAIRQEVLKLMREYNITTTELES